MALSVLRETASLRSVRPRASIDV
uniref:Uncharacterized protein n=1 Tax=Anguilla anguilla TaxID=7936 RepID=A0A0E9P5B5_ANGAN